MKEITVNRLEVKKIDGIFCTTTETTTTTTTITTTTTTTIATTTIATATTWLHSFSNFRLVLNDIFFLFGNSQTPEFYVSEHSVCSIFISDASGVYTTYEDGT